MCCADESRIDFFTRYRANSADLTLLNVTQQACLSCQGQLANFVQKQRTAVGGFDQPASVAGCACESAFFIAEEFRFDQGIGYGCTVHGDDRPISAFSQTVHLARCEFLSGAGLTCNQYRGVGLCNPLHVTLQCGHGGATGAAIVAMRQAL